MYRSPSKTKYLLGALIFAILTFDLLHAIVLCWLVKTAKSFRLKDEPLRHETFLWLRFEVISLLLLLALKRILFLYLP